jgi:mRNA interferase MazF
MTRGTIVLTPFPFTDLQGAKVRPAVVVSRSDRTGEDVILAFISSVVSSQPLQTDLPIDPTIPENRASGLKVPSIVKCDKLATIRRRMILGELGALSSRAVHNLDQRLKYALSLT